MDFFGNKAKKTLWDKVKSFKVAFLFFLSLLITVATGAFVTMNYSISFKEPLMWVLASEVIVFILLSFAYIASVISRKKLVSAAFVSDCTKLNNCQSLNNHIEAYIKTSQKSKNVDTDTQAALVIFEIVNYEKICLSTIDISSDYLKAVAERLNYYFPHAAIICHIETDKFALFFENVYAQSMLEDEIEKLVTLFSKSIHVSDKEFYSTISIGAATYPSDAANASELIHRTLSALYYSKNSTNEAYAFYRDYINRFTEDVAFIKESLSKALTNNEFAIYYQPSIDYKTGDIISLDALIRWKHPEKGNIPPSAFIPIAEETGIIFQIGDWVLRQCCKQYKQWREIGVKPPRITINVSEVQVKSAFFADSFIAIVNDEDVPTRAFTVSISENYTIKNIDSIISQLTKLRSAQIEIEFDNFGIGFASVNLLTAIPLDYVKIDRSITGMIGKERFNEGLIKTTISLAHSKGFKVIGAGIEHKEQLAFMVNHQCDVLQGYLISWPFPAEEIDVMLFLKKKLLVAELAEINAASML